MDGRNPLGVKEAILLITLFCAFGLKNMKKDWIDYISCKHPHTFTESYTHGLLAPLATIFSIILGL